MSDRCTETLDRLYLEYSQLTFAKTAKEARLETAIELLNSVVSKLQDVEKDYLKFLDEFEYYWTKGSRDDLESLYKRVVDALEKEKGNAK
jgi:vacuolar-type H+-ATPase subunit B/Vma2